MQDMVSRLQSDESIDVLALFSRSLVSSLFLFFLGGTIILFIDRFETHRHICQMNNAINSDFTYQFAKSIRMFSVYWELNIKQIFSSARNCHHINVLSLTYVLRFSLYFARNSNGDDDFFGNQNQSHWLQSIRAQSLSASLNFQFIQSSKTIYSGQFIVKKIPISSFQLRLFRIVTKSLLFSDFFLLLSFIFDKRSALLFTFRGALAVSIILKFVIAPVWVMSCFHLPIE